LQIETNLELRDEALRDADKLWWVALSKCAELSSESPLWIAIVLADFGELWREGRVQFG